MSPQDHDGVPQPWQPAPTPAIPVPWDDVPEPAPPPQARALSPRLVLRAIRRHWWQILLIWGLGSAGLAYGIYKKVRPTFVAEAYLEIKPKETRLLVQGGSDSSFETELETQAVQVTHPDVLGAAINDSKVSVLPRIRMALDPEADLRRDVKVALVPKTHLLRVAITTPQPEEGVAIVNTVVEKYKEWASNRAGDATKNQLGQLKKTAEAYNKEVEQKKADIAELYRKANPGMAQLREAAAAKDKDGRRLVDQLRDVVSPEGLQQYMKELSEVEYRLLERSAALPRLRAEAADAEQILERRVKDDLRHDREILEIRDRYDRARDQFEMARSRTGGGTGSDIVVINARKLMGRLKGQYEAAMQRREPALREELRRQSAATGPDAEIRRAQAEVAALKQRREFLVAKINRLRIDQRAEMKAADKDLVDIKFAEQDMARLLDLVATIDKNIRQVEFDTEQSADSIQTILASKKGMLPTDRRMIMMAAAPVLVLAATLALFILLEVRAGRVADPDDLPGRVRLGVIGVVPPLPSLRPSRALPWRNDAARAQREVQAFVQSLDHLRVTLWAGRRPGAGHRCILITSACGSEGKTTLAAQLAGRCANAGLTTLLIDADLRRPALGTLLEVPEGPGLADVLAGEVEPEAALVVIGNAGGFHLLPAGTPGHDPSRLLHGDRLGQLLSQFREAFDIVIVDAPPVLAVPDALLLGRWSDGAVLAVRHDTSRFALVERAHQRLASVGVPVLGAVVNGARSTEAGYSNYTYATQGGSAPQA